MSDFVELQGASGARYRFRLADTGELPAMAGNAVVATGAANLKVVFCGAARSLVQAAPKLREVLAARRGARLFIRLNVSRVTRDAEHADLVAGLEPETHAAELD